MSWLITVVGPYLAMAAFVLGAVYRIMKWMSLPNRLDLSIHPVPASRYDRFIGLLREVFTFNILRRSKPGLWLLAYPFHLSMMGGPLWIAAALADAPITLLRIIGAASGTVMGLSAALLLINRASSEKMRAVSDPADYFNSGLFAVIGWSALVFSLGSSEHILLARQHLNDLVLLRPRATLFTEVTPYVWTLFWVEFFLVYFPWSRMSHMIGKYFSFESVLWGPYKGGAFRAGSGR